VYPSLIFDGSLCTADRVVFPTMSNIQPREFEVGSRLARNDCESPQGVMLGPAARWLPPILGREAEFRQEELHYSVFLGATAPLALVLTGKDRTTYPFDEVVGGRPEWR
jgi:hypothetical protein